MTRTLTTPATPTTFFLPADHLRAAFQCVSTEQARYYLNGVYAHTLPVPPHAMPGTPPAHRLTALDGSQMLIVDLPDGCHIGEKCVTQDHPAPGFILHADHTDKAWKAKAYGGTLWVYGDVTTGIMQFVQVPDKRDDPAEPVLRTGVLEFSVIDGTFPDYNRVVPTAAGKIGPVSYNPDILARLQAAARVMHDGKGSPVQRLTSGETAGDPILVEWLGLSYMRGTLMSVKWA
jgi:hypothetical protein